MKTDRALTGLAAALLLAGVAATQVHAQAQPPALEDNTQLFCQDDLGEMRPMRYANLGAVSRRYASRFNFVLHAEPAKGQALRLTFSDPEHSPYFISYEAQPYTDVGGHAGVALTSMHLFLDNADRDIRGTPMCFFTEFGR